MKNGICSIVKSIDPVASYEAAINERSDNVKRSSSRRTKRSVASHTRFWEPGRTLKIATYDTDQKTVDIVKNIANQWLEHANLKFEFIPGATGDIRLKIEESEDRFSYSLLGTDSLKYLPEEPTMRISLSLEDDEFEGTVLHEFGHALGLRHEHQHPDATIPWDLDKIYDWYEKEYNFDRKSVDTDVLPLPYYSNVTYSDYDPLSIMHYEIDGEVTIDNWKQARNRTLSEKDKETIRKIYPHKTIFTIFSELLNHLKAPLTGNSR